MATKRKKSRRKRRKPRPSVPAEPPVVFMITLGCAKNQVDSERLAGALVGEGFYLTADPTGADLALVNTCAFLESAREETREVLAELQGLKQAGRLRAVLAAGCYPAKTRRIPGADAVVPFKEYSGLANICRKALSLPRRKRQAPAPEVLGSSPRLRFGLKTTAYLKLSEGCSNRCAYCAIPAIRGPARSRPLKDLLAEAGELVADGARELVLIAQDTAAYGTDLAGGRPLLGELMRELLKMRGYHWLRLMYAHPAHLTDDVIELLGERRMARYLDMPIQHADDEVLASMGRGYTADDLRRLIIKVRRSAPRTALRTTCMVGFPGETAAAFGRLRSFLVEAQFDHLGAFAYSPEPGTRAARRKRQVSDRTRHRRLDELMNLQKLIASGRASERIGDSLAVLIESVGAGPALGRSEFQAPEVDGSVIVTRPHAGLAALRPGEFHRAVVTGIHDYDLVARLI